MIIELLPDGNVQLSHAHEAPVRGHVTRRELRLVLENAVEAFPDLLALWKAATPK